MTAFTTILVEILVISEIVSLFRDVLVQFARQLQIFLQKGEAIERSTLATIRGEHKPIERPNAFNMTKWMP